MTYTREQRIKFAENALKEGRIGQRFWRRIAADGRQMVCALAAFGPDINYGIDSCPASFMPRWLAACVPILDDSLCGQQAINHFARGLIERAKRWGDLTATDWETARIAFCRIIGCLPSRSVSAELNYQLNLISSNADDYRGAAALNYVDQLFDVLDDAIADATPRRPVIQAEQPAQITQELPAFIPLIGFEKETVAA